MGIQQGNTTKMALALSAGVDPNESLPNSSSPLVEAIIYDCKKAVQMLKRAGAVLPKAIMRNTLWRGSLYDEKQTLAIKRLLDEVGDPNGWDAGETLLIAARKNNHEIVQLFLDKNADVTGTVGDQLIRKACYHGNAKMVKMLLEHKANPVANPTENEKDFPIELACQSGNVEVIQMLRDAGAILETERLDLVHACEKGRTEMVRFILRENPDSAKEFGRKAMEKALALEWHKEGENPWEIVQLLFDAGVTLDPAEVFNQVSKDDLRPFYLLRAPTSFALYLEHLKKRSEES